MVFQACVLVVIVVDTLPSLLWLVKLELALADWTLWLVVEGNVESELSKLVSLLVWVLSLD